MPLGVDVFFAAYFSRWRVVAIRLLPVGVLDAIVLGGISFVNQVLTLAPRMPCHVQLIKVAHLLN